VANDGLYGKLSEISDNRLIQISAERQGGKYVSRVQICDGRFDMIAHRTRLTHPTYPTADATPLVSFTIREKCRLNALDRASTQTGKCIPAPVDVRRMPA
jgi:hypothetical protein